MTTAVLILLGASGLIALADMTAGFLIHRARVRTKLKVLRDRPPAAVRWFNR